MVPETRKHKEEGCYLLGRFASPSEYGYVIIILMPQKSTQKQALIRTSYVGTLFIFALFCAFALFPIETKKTAFDHALTVKTDAPQQKAVQEAFPFGVDPDAEIIVENPSVDAYFQTHITKSSKAGTKLSWLEKHLFSKLAQYDWYQNLASPISRILVVDSGERKEEVVDNFGDILRWDHTQRQTFTTLIAGSSPALADGKFFPGRYVVNKDATPEEVAHVLSNQFDSQVLSRYSSDIAEIVPLSDTMTIASLLEREAYDFTDMRYISGIIWNRLFADMKLQLDASLQYAKANEGGTSWWPIVLPADKYIDSDFNTYQNKGLPPSPIANPSIEAILAALNPKKTECMFYFHDSEGDFHCTKTYEEHVALLKEMYGRGI